MNLVNGEVVLVSQTARVGTTSNTTERLVVSSVSNETSDGTVSSSVVKHFFENWSNFCKVVIPS